MPLVFKKEGRGVLVLRSNGKTTLGPREEKRWTTVICPDFKECAVPPFTTRAVCTVWTALV